MANEVPSASNYYDGDGSTTQFPVNFEYIDAEYVFAEVDGADTSFTWVTSNTIQFATAPAAGTANVRIYRSTEADAMLAVFSDDTPFLPKYVDKDNTQLLHLIQEVNSAAEDRDTADATAWAAALAAEAATRAAADTAIQADVASKWLRTLRTPDAVDPIPYTAAERANKTLGFDSAGNPRVLTPTSGSAADVLTALASSAGAGMIGYTGSPDGTELRSVAARLDERASILNYQDNSGTQANHTEMLVNALAASDVVYVPAGAWSMRTGVVSLGSNKTVVFDPGAVVTVIPATSAGGMNNPLFTVAGTADALVENATVMGGVFTYDNDYPVLVYVNSYTVNVTVQYVRCNNVRALYAKDNVPGGTYAASTAASRPKYIRVLDSIGYCGTRVTANGFYEVSYLEGGGVERCAIDGYYFGCVFWGGDSNPTVNGAITNERKCKNMRFANLTLGNRLAIVSAAVWGSMGINILIDACIAVGGSASDVGFDFEGCVTSSASNCVAQDFKNGGLALFNLNNGVSFTGCSVIATQTYVAQMALINNSTQSAVNKNIQFTGCNFICNNGAVSVVRDNGAHSYMSYSGNRHYNCGVRFDSNNNGSMVLTSNMFYFDVSPTDSGFAALRLGNVSSYGARTIVRDCWFYTNVTWTTGVGAVSYTNASYINQPYFSWIGGGTTTGFPADLVITHAGTNSGQTLRYLISQVQLYSRAVTITNTGTLAPVGYFENCTGGSDTSPWPSAVPTTGYWCRGQLADARRSATGTSSYMYYICVTTGSPGTWMRSGAVAALS